MNRPPSRLVPGLVAAIVLLAVLVSAGPTLVELAHAAVPLVIAVGVVAVVVRLVWWFSNRF